MCASLSVFVLCLCPCCVRVWVRVCVSGYVFCAVVYMSVPMCLCVVFVCVSRCLCPVLSVAASVMCVSVFVSVWLFVILFARSCQVIYVFCLFVRVCV